MLIFWEYLWLVWVISSLSFVRFYAYVLFYSSKMIARPKRSRFGTPMIIFQVTTKGGISIVQKTVDRVHSVCQNIGYKKYEVWVVTDAEEEFRNCRTIVVPAEFSCNAIHKARALQYAVDLREVEKKNDQDIYVFHLDDESIITTQTLCSILGFAEDSPLPISEGLIIYPVRDEDKIGITNLMDTLRPFCCYECMDFMNRGNPAYIHGSNLLVRSDFERDVGWNNGETIAEDSLFAVAARRRFRSKVFGWHGGVIEERSPYTIKDLIKQRKRWFYGLVQNLRYVGLKDKISQIFRAVIWSSGFLSGLISVFAYLIPQNIPNVVRIIFLVTSVMWVASYQIGAFLNGKYLSLPRRLYFHFLTLISTPIIGLIECCTPILALVSKPKTFEVVEK